MGAADWHGFVPHDRQAEAGRRMPWPEGLPESLRYTALMRYLGLPVKDEDLEFPLSDADRVAARAVARRFAFEPTHTILLHPGARLPSRRWPIERFAQVGRILQSEGWTAAVTGATDEAPIATALCSALEPGAINLCGQTGLGALAALLQDCALLVCNDTGVSHIAAGVGAPSVVIACGSDVARWAPLDRTRHRVLFHDLPCRPCAYRICPIGHICATAVTVSDVLAAVRAKVESRPQSAPQPIAWSST
jgi:ADP-heptose:LPS heptosyltransferase